ASGIRCGHDQVIELQALNMGQENTAGEKVVNGHFEKALDLIRMQVHGHDAVHASSSEHVGHQLGANAHTGLVLAVLTSKTEVRNNGNDALGTCPFGSIHHQQQLK